MSVRVIEGSVVRPASSATHLDVFPPVLVAAFGARWFEEGCLSVHFRRGASDGEPVRASIIADDGGSAAASLATTDGVVLAEGTASVGLHDQPTALSAIELAHEPIGLEILGALEKGDVIGPATTHCASRRQSERVHSGQLASPIEWYHGPSPWGPSVAAPSTVMQMFTDVAHKALFPRIAPSVGLWGGMELRYHGDPVVCDTDYTIHGEVIALSRECSTEHLWYELTARDGWGELVASSRVLTVFSATVDDRPDLPLPATARAGG
jgi:hypothetical protein